MEEELRLLEEADKLLEQLLEGFEKKIEQVFDEDLSDVVSDLVDEMEYPKTSGVVDVSRTARNLVIINRYRVLLAERLRSGIYGESVRDAFSSLDKIKKTLDEYFEKIGGFEKGVYEVIYRESILLAGESLLGAGIEANIVNPIVERIYQHNLQGLKKRELEKIITDYFDSNNIAKRYVKQLASDTLYQMTQHYQNTVSKGLNLKHYLYAGTNIKTTRSFCGVRTGKVFTEKEVKSWAAMDWSGKVAGTNEENIFVYRGGWNCRHTLRPISKKLYEYLEAKN